MCCFVIVVMFGLVLGVGVFSGVVIVQQLLVFGMLFDDLNMVFDFVKVGFNKVIDQVCVYFVLLIQDLYDVCYMCEGGKMFFVKYMIVGDMLLVVMIFNGKMFVFVNVMVVLGVCYVLGQYVWWMKGFVGFFVDEILFGSCNQFYCDCSEVISGWF